MKNTTVQITYPAEKLAAIRQYMDKKDVEMTAELGDALTKLYERHVPKDVREYLESREAAKPEKPRRTARQAPAQARESINRSDGQ